MQSTSQTKQRGGWESPFKAAMLIVCTVLIVCIVTLLSRNLWQRPISSLPPLGRIKSPRSASMLHGWVGIWTRLFPRLTLSWLHHQVFPSRPLFAVSQSGQLLHSGFVSFVCECQLIYFVLLNCFTFCVQAVWQFNWWESGISLGGDWPWDFHVKNMLSHSKLHGIKMQLSNMRYLINSAISLGL